MHKLKILVAKQEGELQTLKKKLQNVKVKNEELKKNADKTIRNLKAKLKRLKKFKEELELDVKWYCQENRVNT